MSAMSVTVVIPAYNAARTIRRAVDSLLAQSRPPEEILVIDDGSRDDPSLVLAEYGHRVRVVRKPNGGASSARNKGIDLAQGDLIAFLDADDYWEPNKLQRQLGVFDKHPQLGLCASRYYFEEPGLPRIYCPDEFRVRMDELVLAAGPEAFETGMMIWTSTVLVRRELLAEDRFEPGLRTAEDRDLWIRLVAKHPVYVLSERLATLVAEPGSLTRSNFTSDYANMLRVVQRYSHLLGPVERRRWEARVFRLWASGHLSSGEAHAALLPAWNRLRRQPFSVEGWWILFKSAALSCVPQPN